MALLCLQGRRKLHSQSNKHQNRKWEPRFPGNSTCRTQGARRLGAYPSLHLFGRGQKSQKDFMREFERQSQRRRDRQRQDPRTANSYSSESPEWQRHASAPSEGLWPSPEPHPQTAADAAIREIVIELNTVTIHYYISRTMKTPLT